MRFRVLFVVGLLFVGYTVSFGYPGGAAGYTQKSGTAGCGCHGSSYKNTSVLVQITGPDTVKAGAVNTYTVRVSGGPSTKAGVDIAASSGSLAAVSTYLKALSGELVHSSAVTYTSGGVDFTFKYTAPSTVGKQTLYATGSSKKYWNFASNKTITVVSATGIDAQQNSTATDFSLVGCYPNPFNNQTKIALALASEAFVECDVYDINGRWVSKPFSGVLTAGNKNLPLMMHNEASGVYFLLVRAENPVTGQVKFLKTERIAYLK